MMQKSLFLLFSLPVFMGFLVPFFRARNLRGNLVSLALFIGVISSVFCFAKPPQELIINLVGNYNIVLGLNKLSRFIIIFVNLLGFLVCLFSKDYDRVKENRFYFSYLVWVVAFANLVCLSADFLVFTFAWGATLVLLYALFSLGSGSSANKALSIVGFGDFSLILGICLYIYSTGTTAMPQGVSIALDNPFHWVSFVLMLIGAFAKAGCGPLHTWIPAASEDTPLSVMAILPASLDKLLGIYLLARICTDFFVLNDVARGLLLLIGGVTIMFAVMMALIQHDLRKLLAYHTISQVGYMVLGFGTGTALGIAGGIFHMVNNAIYKSGLFLSGAAVGQKRNTFDLEKLGGLARYMPITFASALVFALSISGVPPFNGFASKWMLYQGVIVGLFNTTGKVMSFVYIFAMLAAMFGSILTLASFVKFIHAIFLGEDRSPDKAKPSEVSANMKIPLLVLAALCILLGALPYFFLRVFIEPALGQEIYFIGTWKSLVAFVWIIFGLILGFIFYNITRDKKVRQDDLFIGGEDPVFGPSFPATEFYKTVEDMPLVKRAYGIIKLEALDLYNIMAISLRICAFVLFIFVDRLINLVTGFTGNIVLGLSWVFRKAHSGVLDFYLAWSLFGLIVIFFILMVR